MRVDSLPGAFSTRRNLPNGTAPGLNPMNSFRVRGMAERVRRRSPFSGAVLHSSVAGLLSRRQLG